MHHDLRRTTLLALASLIVGCGSDPVDPAVASAAGSYALTTYAGSPLPVVLLRQVSQSPGGPTITCDRQLVERTLELRSDGRFTQTDELRLVCDDGRPPTASSGQVPGTYSVSGSSVQLTFDAPSGVSADYRHTADATLSGETLVVTRSQVRALGVTTTDGTALRYTRQP